MGPKQVPPLDCHPLAPLPRATGGLLRMRLGSTPPLPTLSTRHTYEVFGCVRRLRNPSGPTSPSHGNPGLCLAPSTPSRALTARHRHRHRRPWGASRRPRIPPCPDTETQKTSRYSLRSPLFFVPRLKGTLHTLLCLSGQAQVTLGCVPRPRETPKYGDTEGLRTLASPQRNFLLPRRVTKRH